MSILANAKRLVLSASAVAFLISGPLFASSQFLDSMHHGYRADGMHRHSTGVRLGLY